MKYIMIDQARIQAKRHKHIKYERLLVTLGGVLFALYWFYYIYYWVI